jgi:hypothetical protein
MPTKLIEEYKDTACRHPEHDPATMIVRKPGRYEHACPRCGEVQTFEVPLVTC